MELQIEVWVCPQCHRYFGGSSAGDLRTKKNRLSSMRHSATDDPARWGEAVSLRSHCQHCLQRGVEVERVLVVTTIQVPDTAEAPAAA